MQIYIISSVLFAVSGMATAWYSAREFGTSMWTVLKLMAAVIVLAIPFLKPVQSIARFIGLVAATLVGIVVALPVQAACARRASAKEVDAMEIPT